MRVCSDPLADHSLASSSMTFRFILLFMRDCGKDGSCSPFFVSFSLP